MRPPPGDGWLSRRTNTFALASPSHKCRALPSAARPKADGRRHPTTRAPLALLGPCFKTGLGGPTLRQRPGLQRVVRTDRGLDATTAHLATATQAPPRTEWHRACGTAAGRPAPPPKRPTAPARGDTTPHTPRGARPDRTDGLYVPVHAAEADATRATSPPPACGRTPLR